MLGIPVNDNAGNKITKSKSPLAGVAGPAASQTTRPAFANPAGQPTNMAFPSPAIGQPAHPIMPPPRAGQPTFPSVNTGPRPFIGPMPGAGTYDRFLPPGQSPTGREGYGTNANPNGVDPYLAYLQGQGNAIFGEQGMQNSYLQGQYDRNIAPGFGLDRQDLQANYDRSIAGINNQQARDAITRQGNNNDIGFANRGFDEQQGHVATQRGYNRQDQDLMNMYAAQQGALASRQFGLGNDQNAFAYQQHQRAGLSDAAGRGAIGSYGFGQDRADNMTNLQLSNQNTKLGYDTTTAGINNSLAQGLLGIQRNDTGLDAQTDAGRLSRDRQISNADLSNQTLDQMATEYGVTADQLGGALDRGLQRIGLTQQQAQDGLAEAKRTGNAQATAAWTQIMQEALGYAGQGGQATVQSAVKKVLPPSGLGSPSPNPAAHPATSHVYRS